MTETGNGLDLVFCQMKFKLKGDCGVATCATLSLVKPAAILCDKGMPILWAALLKSSYGCDP